jgi:predicted RNA-binding protein with PUA-like domain
MSRSPATARQNYRYQIRRDTAVAGIHHLDRMQYWLVKQEPEAYAWSAFVKDGKTAWTGVRNFQARNNLRAMRQGDQLLYYHSVSDKQVVGIARVSREAYPDPTAKEGDWSCVDLVPVKPMEFPVALEAIKSDKALSDMALVKQGRLSVQPLTKVQFQRILKLGKTSEP